MRRSPCGERGLKCVEPVHHAPHNSRSPCGERGLKYRYDGDDGDAQRRSPCGERGLKLSSRELQTITVASLPVRGAWIEIAKGNRLSDGHACRSPCGERGLKSIRTAKRRTPALRSLPVRGAWLEIPNLSHAAFRHVRRSPCGERGLKYEVRSAGGKAGGRRSPCGERGLKLLMDSEKQTFYIVAPRAGSVD